MKYRNLSLTLLLMLLMSLLSACHTVEGVGRDIEATGDAIEDAADHDDHDDHDHDDHSI